MSVTAYIALGSNLGDRKANFDGAIQALRETPGISVEAVSPYCQYDAVGGPPGQGKYLNAAAAIQSTLTPEELLGVLLGIEQRFGRVRGEPNAPRTLDLDLLLYGDLVRNHADPIIPHPRMHERRFVLGPLLHIAPSAVIPGRGETILNLLQALFVPIKDVERQADVRKPLAGHRVLVTGSTSGIGLAIAKALAADGALIAVHGRNAERAAQAARSFQQQGVPCREILCDLRESSAVDRLVHAAWNLWRGLDIVVLNAGADTLTGEAAKWPFEKKLSELWAVDVQATIQLSRQLGSAMKQQGHGVILTMGWDQAETGMEGESGQLFATAKGAVMTFTKSLALSLAPDVRVNCLAPGWIKTAWGEKASEAWQKRAVVETPLKRWGTPEDVANVARWLVSPAAQFITGQIVRINGGAVR
jgi:2-amino-4-hydroxy-6-hydroxymethyldihydropteridine diphosphokinase